MIDNVETLANDMGLSNMITHPSRSVALSTDVNLCWKSLALTINYARDSDGSDWSCVPLNN